MKKILSLSVICTFFLLIGQLNYATINQDQDSVEVTETMQEVVPQQLNFQMILRKNLFKLKNPYQKN